jgi:Na+/H+ antiporter NhaD/arsenite permease-like protein
LPSRTKRARKQRLGVFILATLGLAASPVLALAAEEAGAFGAELPMVSLTPFIGILLSIALFPLFAPHWWHKHFPKVSLFWALLFALPGVYLFHGEAIHHILHTYMLEYIPFIALLWALFTIAGGIHLKGTLTGTPGANTVMIAVGTVFASWIGTTGASMIMIRPMLQANAWRARRVHTIVFFIFLVSNIGGSLTPLGDPPLFLGFLIGVPFFWTFHLLPEMLFMSVPILILFYFLDRYLRRREEGEPPKGSEPLRVEGLHNFLLLGAVIGMVFLSGIWHPGHIEVLEIQVPIESIVRDAVLVVLGFISLKSTRHEIHEANGFSWFPIKEVAILFAGIFMTIIPVLEILRAGENGGLAGIVGMLEAPTHYFWVTGSLSAFLDNAPSYLTLVNSALGRFFPALPVRDGIQALIAERSVYLQCISLGAVFFGALTYLGNAPNFMVKSIAEEAGIKMPSFFGFVFRYSLPILVPLFVILGLIFF